MASLSPRQEIALRKFKNLGYFSAYDLQERLPTLNALVRKGLLKCFHKEGYFMLPRIQIVYKLTEAGRNV